MLNLDESPGSVLVNRVRIVVRAATVCILVGGLGAALPVSAQFPTHIDLSQLEASTVVYGAKANDRLSLDYGILMGDLNGDDIPDLVISAANADGFFDDSGNLNTGEQYIFFGPVKLPPLFDLASTAASVTVYGPDIPDVYLRDRQISTIGDLDGDGIGDLIVSAQKLDVNQGAGVNLVAVSAFVIYGSKDWPRSVELDDAVNGVEESGITTIFGPDLESDYGIAPSPLGSMIAGDITGDGIDDLLIGFGRLNGIRVNSGVVNVIYGSSTRPDVVNLLVAGENSQDLRIFGSTRGGQLSRQRTVQLGDVNGDGILDIVMGEPAATSPPLASTGEIPLRGRLSSGAAFVVYGSPNLPAEIDLLDGADVTIYGGGFNHQLTTNGSLALADFNGDGFSDIAMNSGPGFQSTGFRSQIVYGGENLGAIIDLYLYEGQEPRGPNTSPGVIIHTDPDNVSYSGQRLMTADINGDGYDDLIISAEAHSGSSEDPRPFSGSVFVVLGGPQISSVFDEYALNANAIDALGPPPDIVILGEAENHYLNEKAPPVKGDLNGDGFDDLIFGSRRAGQLDEVEVSFRGVAYVLLGSRTPLPVVDLSLGDADVRILGADPRDTLAPDGQFVTGDITGDGADDLAFGTWLSEGFGNTREVSGEVYIVNGIIFSDTARVTKSDPSGDALPRDYGTSRVVIDFMDGNNSSLTTVSLTRSADGVSNLTTSTKVTSDEILGVLWEISTDREGWTSADVDFRYTDSEAESMVEEAIRLFQAPTVSGPWELVVPQLIDLRCNRVSTSLEAFGFFALVADSSSPTVTVEQGASQEDPVILFPVIFDVRFSEDVTDFEKGDVSVEGTAEGVEYDVVQLSASLYTVSVTSATSEGTVVVTIAEGVTSDTVGNLSMASASKDNVVTLTPDFVDPTVTIEQGAGQADPGLLPVVFDVTFSEDVMGLENGDVRVGGTATGAIAEVTAVDDAHYTVTIVSLQTFGTVIVSLDAGAAMDPTGNLSEASTSVDNEATILETLGCSLSPGGGSSTGKPGTDFAMLLVASLALACCRRRQLSQRIATSA